MCKQRKKGKLEKGAFFSKGRDSMKDFQDRVALVTGGSRGIGRAIVRELAGRGCRVAFTYASREDLAGLLVDEVDASGGAAMALRADASDLESAKEVVSTVKERLGTPYYLINNAGITRDKLLMVMTEADWDEVIRTNLKGAFNSTRAVIISMMKAKQGSILNVTSVSGLTGMPGQVNYAASKAGLIGFTKALAKEVAPRGITVNALALGFIETDMIADLDPDSREETIGTIPLGRFGSPEEAARIAAFLISDAASYITGHVLVADGGLSM